MARQPELTEDAVKRIMGCFLSEEELETGYQDLCQNPPDEEILKKVSRLY